MEADPKQVVQAMPGGKQKWEGLEWEEGEEGLMVGKHGGQDMNCPEMLERLGERLRGAIKEKMEGGGKMGGD